MKICIITFFAPQRKINDYFSILPPGLKLYILFRHIGMEFFFSFTVCKIDTLKLLQHKAKMMQNLITIILSHYIE